SKIGYSHQEQVMTMQLHISGQILDVVQGRIYPGTIVIEGQKIIASRETREAPPEFIIPGLVDSHVHIESSLLVPSQFARLAVLHGVTAAVADPHEIANVLGVRGIRYMAENGLAVPFKFHFGAPPCVPATGFETSGSTIGPAELEELLREGTARFLGEMMDFPGAINRDPVVMAKIEIAGRFGRPIDGHAPGLTGDELTRYIAAGITTDHECLNRSEAVEKIAKGMTVMLRNGSAARLSEDMISLIADHPEQLMFCSDDIHPDDLLRGYINEICSKAIGLGYDPVSVLRCATLNPVRHYGLDCGLLQVGDDADLVVLGSLKGFRVRKTYIKGRLVAEDGRSLIESVDTRLINNFIPSRKLPSDFSVPKRGNMINVIEVNEGTLFTGRSILPAPVADGCVVARPDEDILKIAVVNRYHPAPPAVAFVKNFGLLHGAIASSVAHDSHNIIAIGTNDKDLASAVNLIMESRGGLSAVWNDRRIHLHLPVGGDHDRSGCLSDGRQIRIAGQKRERTWLHPDGALHDPLLFGPPGHSPPQTE
ncbi:MAG: adenine deaminase, partial [Smithellaceae bacterium]|nr:adenine deaminase [Smithellaceae bacterium]